MFFQTNKTCILSFLVEHYTIKTDIINYYWLSIKLYNTETKNVNMKQSKNKCNPLDSKQCSHRANECKFLQVSQHWCVHHV